MIKHGIQGFATKRHDTVAAGGTFDQKDSDQAFRPTTDTTYSIDDGTKYVNLGAFVPVVLVSGLTYKFETEVDLEVM